MFRRRKFRLCLPAVAGLPSRTLVLGERTLVMGVLNVTPDSFSDGGLSSTPIGRRPRARNRKRRRGHPRHRWRIRRALAPRQFPPRKSCGASCRCSKLRGRLKIPISIDTSKAEVAEAAAAAGAEILNDVTALCAIRASPKSRAGAICRLS